MNDGTLCNQKHVEKIVAALVQLTAELIGVEGVGYSEYTYMGCVRNKKKNVIHTHYFQRKQAFH